MALVIVSANTPAKMRNKGRAKRLLRELRADSIGLQEGQGLLPALPIRGYRVLYDRDSRDQRRGAKDTIVLTRNSHHSLGTLTLQASEEVSPTRFAPDRWITASCYEHPMGPVAHVNIHPNATVMNRVDSAPIVREYAEHSVALDHVLSLYRDEGFIVVVTGDLNWRRKAKAAHSPYEVFAAHKLRVVSHGIDAIAFPREFRADHSTVPKYRTGSDHDWLYARLHRR